MFLRNDRDLGVKNGTLAAVEQAARGRLVVRLDGGGAAGAAARTVRPEGPKPRTAEQIRQALRDAFAQSGQAKPKTPEQIREAPRARDKPAAVWRPGKDQGKDQGKERER